MALKVGELFASFNLDTSGVDSAVSFAEKRMGDIGKGLAIGGAAMTAAVTVPLKKAAQDVYQAGSGFDAQMSKVFAIIGEEATGSAEVMKALRDEALEMGSTTAFTASQAGEAMEYMAMAGWKTKEMLSAVEPLMDLAAAAGADLGTTSDIVTDAMTAFGLSATDTVQVVKDGMTMNVNAVEYFADILAAASSNSNTNITMLGESFKYAASLAGSLGYSVNDVAIALGLMANTGIKSTMAGTSFSRVIQNMAKPSAETAKAMEALGISLYDSRGQAKSFRDIMLDFRAAAKVNNADLAAMTKQVEDLDAQFTNGKISEDEYTAQLEKLTAGSGDFLANITRIAGARGLPGLLAIMNATDADFDKLTLAIDNSTGAAAKMKAVMLDNAKGDVTLFNSALEGLEITLWGLAENGFRKTVREATALVDSFRNADRETQTGTLRLAALAAAAGPVMAGMGGIIAFLPKLATAFSALTGPVALLAIGMVALGAAAIDSGNSMGKTFVKGAAKAGDKVKQLGKDVKAQLPALKKNMGEFLSSLSAGFEQGIPGIMEGLTDILTSGVSAIADNLGNIADVAQTIVKALADGIVNGMPDMVSSAFDLLTGLGTALISNIPTVQGSIARVMTSIVREISKTNWSEIGTKLNASIRDAVKESGTLIRQLAMGDQYTVDASWADVGAALANKVLDGIKTAFGNTKDFIGSLLLGERYSPDEDWNTVGGKIIDKVFESVDGAASGAAAFVGGILDALAEAFSVENIAGATDALSGIVSRIITAAAEEIPKLAEHAGTILAKLGELIFGKEGEKGLAASALEGAGNLAKAILGAIVEAIPNVEQAGETILNTLAGILAPENFKEIGDAAKALAGNILTGIADGIKALGASAANILTAICDALFTTDESGDSAVTAGVEALTGIVQTIFDTVTNDVIPSMGDAVGGILTAIAGFFKKENLTKLGTSLGSLGESIIRGIADAIGAAVDAVVSIVDGAELDTVVDGIGASLGNMAEKLVSGLTYAIPKLVDAGGKLLGAFAGLFSPENLSRWVSGAGDLAKSIIGSIVTALSGDANGQGKADLSGSFAGLAQGIASGIVTAVEHLPELLDNVLSVGAQIANAVMGSITSALSNAKESGIGSDLAKAATNLLHGLLTSITDFGNNEDIQGFIKNIGAGLRDSLYLIGEFTGDLVLNLFSAETLKKVWEAGKSIIGLLIQGIGFAIDGIGGLLDGIVSSILDRLGLIDKEKMKEELDVGKQLSAAIEASVAGSSGAVEHTAETAFATIVAAFGAGKNEAFEEMIEGSNLEDVYNKILEEAWKYSDPSSGFTGDKALLQKIFTDAFIGSDFDIGPILEKLPDDFWQIAYDSITGNANQGEGKPILDMLLSMLLGNGISSAAKQAAEAEDEAYAKALQETNFVKTEESMKDALEGASEQATQGMQKTFADEKTPVANGAAEVSDAAVKQFLLTMSAENGAAIASGFTGAMIAEILADGEDILNASNEAATAALSAFSGTLSTESASSIGLNFSDGIASGIRAGESAVVQAAVEVATAAIHAATGTLDINSPSKRARDEVGLMYGKGLAEGILGSMPEVMSASSRLSAAMHDQMDVRADRMNGGLSTRRMTVYAGAGRTISTVNNPTNVYNRYLNIDHYYQRSAEDVDYLMTQLHEENEHEQSGLGM